MATRKRNEYLDIDSSDEEGSDRGYDSEAAEESKGRASKRRKVVTVEHDDDNDDDVDVSDSENEGDDRKDEHGQRQQGDREEDEEKIDDASSASNTTRTTTTTTKKKKQKPLDNIKPPKKDKTGVVYLSSLPPYLKPAALKTLLLQRGFGPITRVFLTPAVPSNSGPKQRSNRRKTYTDGWVEFASKQVARVAAETLNANLIGGKKGGFYHDDVWNMKYLRGFKWADLMEQVQRERSEREARRRIEDARARKEDKLFLTGVEKGKVVEGIRKKREEKGKKSKIGGESEGGDEPVSADLSVRMVFKQNEVRSKGEQKDFNALGEDTKRVLGKIF